MDRRDRMTDDAGIQFFHADGTPLELAHIRKTTVLGVDYVYVPLVSGDDLYVTAYGIPFASQMLPENFWTDKTWFQAHHERLPGTSSVYRITTRAIGGRSKDIVLKWNRMGQDIPGETQVEDLAGAEFNSPFEEFSLAMELRNARHGSPARLLTQKPLAIYVPAGHAGLASLGRRAYKIEAKKETHTEIELDASRKYAVIYEWIKGIDAAEAHRREAVSLDELKDLVARAKEEMAQRGFRVRDNKAHHLIVRTAPQGGLVRDRQGEILYGSIDFELLERTPQRERAVRAAKRRTYLVRQARRFEADAKCPENLTPVRISGVDYIYGPVESTKGALWVVGRDPGLFEYFLPEKWRRTARTKLSVVHEMYETKTKDNIHLVWKVSRVGEQPDLDPFKADEKRILDYGYNSPFEEIALDLALTRKGIATTYPRAIYMTGSRSKVSDRLSDDRRYKSHRPLRTPEGEPILRRNHDYIIIWGYWNGPDELLALEDKEYYRGISALDAYREGVVDEETYLRVMEVTRRTLTAVGIEDLNLRGNHFLLSLDDSGALVRDSNGMPTVRICNFELLRRIDE